MWPASPKLAKEGSCRCKSNESVSALLNSSILRTIDVDNNRLVLENSPLTTRCWRHNLRRPKVRMVVLTLKFIIFQFFPVSLFFSFIYYGFSAALLLTFNKYYKLLRSFDFFDKTLTISCSYTFLNDIWERNFKSSIQLVKIKTEMINLNHWKHYERNQN